MLDQRQYATTLQALRIDIPTGMKYTVPALADVLGGVNNGATPPTFVFCLAPANNTYLATRNDGRICINNRNERWREALPGNDAFDSGSDCAWDNRSCTLSGEG